jgi:hypothetical protein
MIIIHDSSYRDRMRVNESELDPECDYARK